MCVPVLRLIASFRVASDVHVIELQNCSEKLRAPAYEGFLNYENLNYPLAVEQYLQHIDFFKILSQTNGNKF